MASMTVTGAGLVLWAPEDLPIPIDALAGSWSYCVLEEIVDEIALLCRWRWPVVDRLGHLLWPHETEHDAGTATITVGLLRAQLYTPNGLQRRPRCGDTFAISRLENGRWDRAGRVADLRQLFGELAYDISADAREAAKIAYQGSLVAIRPPQAEDEDARSRQATALRERANQPLDALTIIAPPGSSNARRRL
jgi:hypothetical protein